MEHAVLADHDKSQGDGERVDAVAYLGVNMIWAPRQYHNAHVMLLCILQRTFSLCLNGRHVLIVFLEALLYGCGGLLMGDAGEEAVEV